MYTRRGYAIARSTRISLILYTYNIRSYTRYTITNIYIAKDYTRCAVRIISVCRYCRGITSYMAVYKLNRTIVCIKSIEQEEMKRPFPPALRALTNDCIFFISYIYGALAAIHY